MASKIEVDEIFNAGGDNDTGIDLATNDQILLKVANATKLTMNSTGQVTVIGEGTATTNLQQGLCKGWSYYTSASSFTLHDSFNASSLTDSGAGDGRTNLTNSMAGTQRRMTSGCAGDHIHCDGGESTSQIMIVTRNTSNTNADSVRTSAGVWGDLA